MKYRTLPGTELRVSEVCLGTMTWGEQNDEPEAHAQLGYALDQGVNFIDTAEMYPVPPNARTQGSTETILGNWLGRRGRDGLIIASKVAGPGRRDWIRNGRTDLTRDVIAEAVETSLARLQIDCIDLYQIHWPNRNVPTFGALYFDPAKDDAYSSVQEQLEGLAQLVQAGKVRHVGLSNETPYGVCEFVRIAEQYGLPRIATVQNPYSLTSRAADNGLDETLYRLGVSLLAYSPLAFGALTGKYDEVGIHAPDHKPGRLALFERMKQQRWCRNEALAVARQYNELARAHGLTPVRMALAFCYSSWRVASTIIGITTRAQLDEDLDAWGTTLSPELLAQIDAIRWTHRDPAA